MLRLFVAMAIVWLGAGCAENNPYLASSSTPTNEQVTRPEFDIEAFAWTHRPVIVFATTPAVAQLQTQRQSLAAEHAGLNERDMVVVEVIGDQVALNGEPVNAVSGELRRRYGVTPDQPFAVLLIGKDTGVKLRTSEPVTPEQLFALIDSMPMRKRELRDASE